MWGLVIYSKGKSVLSELYKTPDVEVLVRIHGSYILARMGNYQKAYDTIEKIERAPQEILKHKLQLLGLLGRWDEAKKLLMQFKALGLSLPADMVGAIKSKKSMPFKPLVPMARVGQSLLEISQSLSEYSPIFKSCLCPNGSIVGYGQFK